jgi:hypothetical protein
MSPLHQTPRGGLDHRVFEGMGPADQVLAAYAFEPPLDEPQIVQAQALLDAWSQSAERAEAEEPCHCDEPFLGPRTLRMRVHNLVRPREALREFQTRLAQALPLREAHHSRWAAVEDREEPVAVLDPDAPEERTQFPAHADYLQALFDPASLPPASEYESQGKGAFETRTGDIVLEDRGVPFHLPPLRIGYGTAQAPFTAVDARTHAVRDALGPALTRTFGDLAGAPVPRFFDHTGKLGEVDRIAVAGRVGCGFAFASPELVQRLSTHRFRYREAELFEALTAVIAAAGLAPRVSWQRFGKPFAKSWKAVEMHVFQLWEPG